jgi:hypothetical protein
MRKASISPPVHSVVRPRSISTVERLFWLSVLVGHLIAAALWWWLEPGGFPWGHPRFWSNRVLPGLALVWVSGALVSLHREDLRRLCIWLPALPAAWLATAIAGRLVFPITFAWIWLVPLGVSVAMAASLTGIARHATPRPTGAILSVACVSIALGCAAVLNERPLPPGTQPRSTDLPGVEQPVAGSLSVTPPTIDLGSETRVYTSDGSLNVRLAPLTLTVTPLLRFLSRSADGCWTILTRPDAREGPEPRVRGARRLNDQTWVVNYDFPGQGPATLHFAHDPQRKTISIDAATRLDRPVFSHLNSFCDIEVRGHRRLALQFSPCGGKRIDVLRFDYPFGRPARFAYVDEARRFRVVEASSGEKGPFRTLAEGQLERSSSLAITLCDEDRAIGRLTLLDWSAQVSTQLSPTAGWGVPENAIEFSLSGDEPTSPASLFITLAATSVGRGWDCVGHAAGMYRNRIAIEPGTPASVRSFRGKTRDS